LRRPVCGETSRSARILSARLTIGNAWLIGALARKGYSQALAYRPKLILADEPVSMLDVSIRIGLLNLMTALREQEGVSILYITHDIASARYVSDRLLVMYAGHIVESGPVEDVLARPKHPYTQLLLSAVPDPRAPLSQGWLRLSHRATDPARSLPWRPWHPHQSAEPVIPGHVHLAAVEMWPTCVVLPAGSRLALSVAGRDFARPDGADGFHGSGPFAHNDPADRPPARAASLSRVHTGGQAPSSLLLPVIR